MAFQRIRIKNSSVAGKVPDASALDAAELALNLKDQKLYSKDADGNVFELGGGRVESGPTPPPSGNEIGDLFWDGDFLLVWNGSEWVTVGQSDLDYTPAADKGTITNTNGEGVDLPLVDNTNAGLMSPDEHKKLGDMPVIISGGTFPGTPALGDIWFDTSDCPPTINIWDDCDDPGNPVWKPIGGGELPGCQQGPVQIIGDSEIGSTLTATGGAGIDEGTQLPATYEWTGAKTGTGSTIVADVEGDYTVTATITCIDGSQLSTSSTKTVSDSYVDMVNNTPPVIAVVGEGPDGAYEGNSLYVVTPATVINGTNPVIVENQWFKDGADPVTSQLYAITAADIVGTVITCRQLFRDARTNEILSDASNGITIVARPAGAITFAAVITDDGTPNANTPGHVLTASAQNIQGGTAPVEYEYKWLVGGLTMGTNKTLNIIQTFVGQVVSCEVTVAEPDGTNPETRTAVYDKVIEIAGAINTPTVLAPEDGAGSGDARYLKSDTIISIEESGFDATYTGDPAPGYEGPNVFDLEVDKLPFPDGEGGLDNSALQKSTRPPSNGSVTITFNEDIKVSPTSEVYILFQSEATSGNNNKPTVTIKGRNSEFIAVNPDDAYRSAVYRWLQIPATVGDIHEIVIQSTSTIAGLAQVKVDGVNITEGYRSTTLTLDGDTNLADMTGEVFMTDGTGTPGPYSQTPYKLVTSQITDVDDTDPAAIVLTFADPCPDLQYFKVDDVVQTTPDEVKVIAPPDVANRKLTVDGGDWNNGDVVEYQTKGGKGTIISVDEAANTITLTSSTDRDERWIAENQGGINFAVAGPSIVDDPLLTADVRLESSLFATTPADSDTLKNIVWELNGATQDAGMTHPYTPTLNTNTTYTVRVKHQGNALEDSAWSASTTFTTGATRNLYTYYKERVELLEARIAGIEADEIVDDATDVTLLTAFANLVERVEALENP